ncbi:pyrroline-5-carboxylate reductase ProC (plasmid) [Phaeobacter piscinae]|uniref:Pyrroline-5-carboxylate reductase n=1 Tax=Phaeobacter piscinae TaxID=1580596 RepID=A0ABN5DK05_9RHOB|nr:pyrroline-5-carboxylate reductase [Phaeobacter piscinae]ATG37790.1 pyrroline-5-carboxylate reductase ProC [Phaeobacter piscinae]AUQ88311.1 pyrroline-5-carboxylate reductase ProC [Phaeobacter piscinae]AUR26194.1 pyrroline-5-carboxylate reductase ProC [Phaeobacter piscinae]
MDKITFIGGGNMASAIIGGLISCGWTPSRITVVDPNADQRDRLASEHGIHATDDVASAAAADIIVLAVKPQVIAAVAKQMDADLSGKLILSIAAGVTIASLESFFGPVAIARTMPNTPALLGLGATGLYVNEHASEAQRVVAKGIIAAFGISVAVEREDLLDAVTAVSGSGPAYYFLMIEEMIRAGTTLGLSPEDASALTLQTALGASTMASKGDAPEVLRARVTSPNGTTHAAVISMQENGFGEVIAKAMTACRERAVELGKA